MSAVDQASKKSGANRSEETPFQRVLASFAELGPEDVTSIKAAVARPRTHLAGSPIKAGGSAYAVVHSGWVGCGRVFRDGRRQIAAVFIPGDILVPVPPGADDVEYFSLTNAIIVDPSPILRRIDSSADSNLALAWQHALDRGRTRLIRHIIRLGGLSAYERTACFFLELYERQRRARLTDGPSISFPLSQEVLAEILGITPVHMNRVIQSLRREGILTLNRTTATATIGSLDRMAEVAMRI